MTSNSNKSRYNTTFGAALGEQISRRSTTQRAIAEAVGKSPAYVNHTMSGVKPASAAWVDLVADAMCLNDAERGELHRAAAQDAGFKIDLAKRR